MQIFSKFRPDNDPDYDGIREICKDKPITFFYDYIPQNVDQLQINPITNDESLIFSSGQVIDGVNDRVIQLKENAEIRRNGSVIKADEISYDLDTDIVNATIIYPYKVSVQLNENIDEFEDEIVYETYTPTASIEVSEVEQKKIEKTEALDEYLLDEGVDEEVLLDEL